MSFACIPSTALSKCPNHLNLISLTFSGMLATFCSFLISSFLFLSHNVSLIVSYVTPTFSVSYTNYNQSYSCMYVHVRARAFKLVADLDHIYIFLTRVRLSTFSSQGIAELATGLVHCSTSLLDLATSDLDHIYIFLTRMVVYVFFPGHCRTCNRFGSLLYFSARSCYTLEAAEKFCSVQCARTFINETRSRLTPSRQPSGDVGSNVSVPRSDVSHDYQVY